MARQRPGSTTSTFPIADKNAITGSNVPRNRLTVVREKEMAERCAPLLDATKRYRREVKGLLSKPDLKSARAVVAHAKRELLQASATIRARAEAYEARRQAVQTKMRRLVARAVPQYRDVRAAQRTHFQQLDTVVSGWQAEIPTIDGLLEPEDPPGATVFRPPFALADVHVTKGGDAHIDVVNRSFVAPDIGHVIVDADFDDDEHTSFSDGLWDLLFINVAEVVASCGANYRVPRTGRLRITATLKNFYNQTTLSLKDNWGFSAGTLRCQYQLFSSVMRATTESMQRELLFAKKLTSDGDNTSGIMPDIDQTGTLALDMTTEQTFDQDDRVWVLVGSIVHVFSRLDDMHSHVRTLLWWRVNRITVSVA